MDRIQTVIAGAGVLCFLWFAAPLVANGILNLGNLTGMGMSALLIIYGVGQKRIHVYIAEIARARSGRVILLMICAMAALVAGTALAETYCMVKSARNAPPPGTPAVVLGCSVKGTRPGTILAERLNAAYRYLQKNPGSPCILSGGQGPGEEITEAECMYRYLTGKGIDAGRLILEEASTNTEENLLYTREILEERGLGSRIAIITSEFHEYRAGITAGRLGLVSYSVPAGTHIVYFPTYYVRELYGILYYQFGKRRESGNGV